LLVEWDAIEFLLCFACGLGLIYSSLPYWSYPLSY